MKIKDIEVPVEDDDDDNDEGSYIELVLEPKPRCHEAEQVFQFRLSFSSMSPRNSDSGGSFQMPAESVESTSSENYMFTSDYSSMSPCSSSSSAVLERSNARRNPYEMVLNLRSSPENSLLYDCKTASELPEADKRTRSKVRKVISSGLVKLIIKFRTIKAKSKISLSRASNLIFGPEHVTHRTERFDYSCYESPIIEPFSERERKRNSKSKLPEVSIYSIKGMIDSLTVSCPASVKSSPIHRNYCATEGKTYTRENSIKAAIAHCKMSLHQAAP